MTAQALAGRTRELAIVRVRLEALSGGRPFALVLQGEPGIGKSSLLEEAARRGRADGARVLRAAGSVTAAELPFAALRTLLEPLLGLRARLPAGQAQALGAALALEPPSPRDRFAVAAAVLGLLGLAAQDGPLLLIVDDVQWLDRASRDAVLFAARRLPAAPIGVLLGRREDDGAPAPDDAGLERLAVAPLEREAAAALLARGPVALTPRVAGEVLDAASGNPLALVELPRLLSAQERAGQVALPSPLRPGAQVRAAFARRLRELPVPARDAMTVAAAMEAGPIAWLVAALAQLDLDESALGPAEEARMLVLADGQLAFRHALVRAAAYHAAPEAARRAAHRVLAQTAPEPRLRAVHLAAAAEHADAAIADALEEAAQHALEVGGVAEAGWAFARAAELSTDDAQRARRALQAARHLAADGQIDRAVALLDGAQRRAGADHRSEVARLRGLLDLRRGDPAGAQRRLAAAARERAAQEDVAGAAELLLHAVLAGTMVADNASQRELVASAQIAGRRAGGRLELFADALAAAWTLVRGDDAAARDAMAALDVRLLHVDPVELADQLGLAAQTWLWLGEHARAARICAHVIGACEEAGALGHLAFPLDVRAQLHFRDGAWDAALADGRAAVDLARDTGQDTILAFNLAMLGRTQAARGEVDGAEAHLQQALAIVAREGNHGHAAHINASRGLARLAAGDPEGAVDRLGEALAVEERAGWRHPQVTQASVDLMEALVLAGRRDDAHTWIERWEGADAAAGPWARILALRGRLAFSADADVGPLAAALVAAQAMVAMPFEHARSDLLIGERLRRLRLRSAAREPLERALTTFEALGAVPWADRTRDALLASGGRADGGGALLGALSEHERRVARFVARGMTNREIAVALHLSPKTIERQLGQIYRRLGVRSRTELARLVTQAS